MFYGWRFSDGRNVIQLHAANEMCALEELEKIPGVREKFPMGVIYAEIHDILNDEWVKHQRMIIANPGTGKYEWTDALHPGKRTDGSTVFQDLRLVFFRLRNLRMEDDKPYLRNLAVCYLHGLIDRAKLDDMLKKIAAPIIGYMPDEDIVEKSYLEKINKYLARHPQNEWSQAIRAMRHVTATDYLNVLGALRGDFRAKNPIKIGGITLDAPTEDEAKLWLRQKLFDGDRKKLAEFLGRSPPRDGGSSVAIKHDDGKLPLHLLPFDSLEAVTEILAFGAKKYGERNWEKGMDWSRLFRAATGHLWAWFLRRGNDPETGRSHLWHAGCCVLFLIAYEIRGTGTDDRP